MRMKRRKLMLAAIYVCSSLYLFGSVALLIVSIKYAFKYEPAEPKQEPSHVWVLGLEEALSSL
jgi:hypothetical protein